MADISELQFDKDNVQLEEHLFDCKQAEHVGQRGQVPSHDGGPHDMECSSSCRRSYIRGLIQFGKS